MVLLDNMKIEVLNYEEPLKELAQSLHLEDNDKRIEELEMEMQTPTFWDNPERANKLTIELKSMQSLKETVNGLFTQFDDILTLIEMGEEETDENYPNEVRAEHDDFIKKFED